MENNIEFIRILIRIKKPSNFKLNFEIVILESHNTVHLKNFNVFLFKSFKKCK